MPVASGLYYSIHQGADRETPPVVLIHGAGGNHLYWPSEIRRLLHHRVFALDLPGHGKSEGRGQQSIHSYATGVLEWLQSLNLPRAVFIGHSMGAAIAATIAVQEPDCVIGLGLISAGARLPVPQEIMADSANPTTFHRAVQAMGALAFSSEADPRLVEMAVHRMAEIRSSVLYGDFLACASFDITDHLSQILQPTLIICGSEDHLTPPRYSQLLSGLIPSARLEIVFGAGHMTMLEQPQAVAGHLAVFLDSIPYVAG